MDTKYLFKRHNTWWVKVAVPRTLKKELGFDLRESLKTHDLNEAQKLKENAEKKLKEYNEIIENSKKEAQKIIDELSKNESMEAGKQLGES